MTAPTDRSSPAPTDRSPPATGRLSLRGLRMFIALEEAGSVAEAARQLRLSKSNVSQHITTLEQNVGARLFDRTQKPVTLTPAGQMLSLHAHRIIAMISAAETSLAEVNLHSLPLLNFAIIDDLDATITPALAASLQAQLPQCFIRTFSGRSDQVTARLVSREADIAVTARLPDDLHRFDLQALAREKYVLVAAKGRYRPKDDWRAQLSDMPLVQYSEAMPMGRQVATHLKRVGLHVPRRFSFEATRSVIATVATTGGWTLSTPLAILDAERFRDRVDLFALPFPGPSRDVHMISRSDELGALPAVLGRQFRDLLRTGVLAEFTELAPHLVHALEVFDDPNDGT